MSLQDRVAERVTERKYDQRSVLRADRKFPKNRAGIGQKITVAEHDSLRRTGRTGGEKQHGEIVALPPRGSQSNRLAAVFRQMQQRDRGIASMLRAVILGPADQYVRPA